MQLPGTAQDMHAHADVGLQEGVHLRNSNTHSFWYLPFHSAAGVKGLEGPSGLRSACTLKPCSTMRPVGMQVSMISARLEEVFEYYTCRAQ